jgi:hypothetical protein
MPFGDGTGPAGMGPMTGRAAGYCAGYGVPAYMKPIGGRGFWGRGRGGGRGRGFGHGFGWARAGYGYMGGPSAGPPYPPQPMTAVQEIDILKSQAGYFKDALDGIAKRMEELEKEKSA